MSALRILALVVFASLAALAAAGLATPASAVTPPKGCSYSLSLRAVGDRQRTDLDLALAPRRAGCGLPTVLRDVRVVGAGRRLDGHAKLRVRKGQAQLELPPLPRHGRVTVRALVGRA